MVASAAFALLVAATPAPSLKIDHLPLGCFVKDRFAIVEADIEPQGSVAKAVVYFKAENADQFHYVPMTLSLGRFRAKLPRPKDKAGSVVYYVEATDGSAAQRTPEMSALVVKSKDACPEGGSVAADGPEGDIRVYATSNGTQKPAEFSGIQAVTAARAAEAAAAEASPAPSPGPAAAPSGSSLLSPNAQASAPPSASSPAPATSATPDDFEYMIGPNDILKIAVFGNDDLTQAVLVQQDGTFMYPLIGRVKGSDMTTKELERKLVVLLAKGYIRNPQVTVSVQEARSRSVYVLGEVTKAGTFSMADAKTILDLAALAGISNTADIMIVRPRGDAQGPILPSEVQEGEGADPAKKAELLRVSVRDIQAGDLSQNIRLRPNDTVFVLQGKRVYVLGEVRAPGGFAPPVGATVEQMILLAGGFTDRASTGNIRISREVDGKKQDRKAKPSENVQPGDVITVKAKLF